MPDSELFELFKREGYRFGHCFVQPYDRKLTSVFSEDFLFLMYRLAKPRIKSAFCGMEDTSASGICAYLSTRNPLLLMCIDDPAVSRGFDVIGFAFPTVVAGPKPGTVTPDPGRSIMLGYVFDKLWWGKPEIVVGMMLCGVYFFQEFNALSLHGQSLPSNQLTRKFLRQFGVRDTGVIPDFLMHDGRLVDCRLSSLDRQTFEEYVRRVLAECSTLSP